MKKLTNIEKLEKIGILDEIRLKYGAKDANDASMDDLINKRSNTELIEDWCAWKLGYPDW